MTTVKNDTDGPRAVLTTAGEVIFAKGDEREVTFAPGGITAARMIGLDVDGEDEAPSGADVLADLMARAEKAERERDEAFARLSAMDRDGDGAPGGSTRDHPPALTGKNKAELLAIAANEGVEIEDGATDPDIVSAIDLNRGN